MPFGVGVSTDLVDQVGSIPLGLLVSFGSFNFDPISAELIAFPIEFTQDSVAVTGSQFQADRNARSAASLKPILAQWRVWFEAPQGSSTPLTDVYTKIAALVAQVDTRHADGSSGQVATLVAHTAEVGSSTVKALARLISCPLQGADYGYQHALMTLTFQLYEGFHP